LRERDSQKKQKKVKRGNQGGKNAHKHDGPVRRNTVAPAKKKEADPARIKLQLGDKHKSAVASLAPAVRFSEKPTDKDKSEGLHPQKTMLSPTLHADDMITEDQESLASIKESRTSKQTSK